jgi:hypothetical protein
MKPLAIFSWGYYGWGNWTKQLVKAVDAVEESRGYKPPIFVDVRLRREVRAPGFSGGAFERLLGSPDRYRWMKSLGNEAIADDSLGAMKIADPKSASELLAIACEAAKLKRRVIFFCSCRYPKHNLYDVTCHRTEVARLVLKAARRQRIAVEIAEWPGGSPRPCTVEVTAADFRAVKKNRLVIHPKRVDLAELAGLPWGTFVSLRSKNESLHRLVGPLGYQGGKWGLPVFDWFEDPNASLENYRRASVDARKHYGFNSCSSL